jgi:hypothetical protein
MERYTQKKMEHVDKALLQAVNSEINGVSKDNLSLQDLINSGILEDDTSFAERSDGCVDVSVVIMCDSSGNLKSILDENCAPALGVTRDIKLTQLAAGKLDYFHSFMCKTWTLKRKDGSEWHCCLEGDRGKSRLMLSAALHFSLYHRLPLIDQDGVMICKPRTKLIKAGDFVEFFIVKVTLYPQYQYSRGMAYVSKVRIDFNSMTASSEHQYEAEVTEYDLDLELLQDQLIQEQCEEEDMEYDDEDIQYQEL